MLTPEQREAIVKEAKTWVGTPYRGWSRIKRRGTDCGQLLAGVFINAGHLPAGLELPKGYSLQVAQHREDTAYIEMVRKYMNQIPEHKAEPGDVVVYKLGLAFAHAGIIVSWPVSIIHAMAHHGVTFAHGRNHPRLRHTEREFYTLKDEYSGVSE